MAEEQEEEDKSQGNAVQDEEVKQSGDGNSSQEEKERKRKDRFHPPGYGNALGEKIALPKKVAMNTVIISCRSSGTKKKDFHVASRDSSASTTNATPTDSTAHHEKENRVGHEGLGR